MNQEIDDDDTWAPPPPTTDNEPDCDYLLVSKESLMNLLRQCTVCRRGKNNLSFRMDGLGFTCTRECNLCGMRSPWENSKPLRTANPSGKERLPKINVDVVAGSVLTAMGGTKLRQIMLMSGIHSLSMTTFHKIKKIYVAPAIDREFSKMQQGVIDALRRKIEQGEKVHLSGDGSYDTRGYSAHWCRYFLLNAETSEVRATMTETPYAKDKKRRAALAKKKREIDRQTRPIVPSRFDSNLEEERESEAEEEERESEDEEEERDSGEVDEDEIVLSPSDLLQQELIFVDDVNLEESDNEDENEEEDEE
ncbi:hypothetical protein PRIPAC_78440 [Pristionchus pacificus]|uniref:Mutator-like transposase domain-containing protein n=1 Tax=Pristionchus pacificus TaxID=54126 RepID=A0A2A6BYG1_PRIPA|nr:hypothetical protein PRIPAC_78440 [Pristionchus pacificus]|eukprot:PDM70813.1 hypothetical protein PRIPAC_45017 [Pristionchus pacificus]